MNDLSALEYALTPLAENGHLYVAIYNDQVTVSALWTKVKRMYCSSALGKGVVLSTFLPLFFLRPVAVGLIKYGNPLGQFTRYKKQRGMSIYHDWVDWLGGYPFEVAKPEVIFRFYRERGLTLTGLTTTQRLGCNEFVFKNTASDT